MIDRCRLALVSSMLAVACWVAGAPSPAVAGPDEDRFLAALDAFAADRMQVAIVHGQTLAERKKGPWREPALYLVGRAFAEIHLYEKGEQVLNALLQEHPNGRFAGPALAEISRVFFELHEWPAVVALTPRVARLPESSPAAGAAWYRIGQSHYLSGDANAAIPALERVAPTSPWYPFARFTLGQTQWSTGRTEGLFGQLEAIEHLPGAPRRLLARARRTRGIAHYQLGRFAEATSVLESVPRESHLFGTSRLDLARAALALGDEAGIERAIREAREADPRGRVGFEATLALAQLDLARGRLVEARDGFEAVRTGAEERGRRLRAAVAGSETFAATWTDLAWYWARGRAAERRERLLADNELFRAAVVERSGQDRPRALPPEPPEFRPATELFAVLHPHFHRSASLKPFVELGVDLDELVAALDDVDRRLAARLDVFRASPPVLERDVPAEIPEALDELVWLVLLHFDVTSRVVDELAIAEKLSEAQATEAKRLALHRTIDALRRTILGDAGLLEPDRAMALLDRVRAGLEDKSIHGAARPVDRERLVQQLELDRQSMRYVLENLERKGRQMTHALEGLPLRSRNFNVPILTTVIDWYRALRRLASKYEHLETRPGTRPWALAGRGSSVREGISGLRERLAESRGLLERAVLQESAAIVELEESQHALLQAQAEAGLGQLGGAP